MEKEFKFIIGNTLNWYSERSQYDIRYLEMYHKETEASIKKSIKDFDNGKEWVLNDNDNPSSGGHLLYKDFDGFTFALEDTFKKYYPNLKRQGLLILIMSTIEKKLSDLCNELMEKEKSEINLNDIYARNGLLNRIKKYMEKVVKLPLSEELVENWDNILTSQLIRNELVHEIGFYSEERDKKNKFKIRKFIEHVPGIEINDQKEYILEKEFIEFIISLANNIFMSIEDCIRKKYDEKYKLN